IDILRIIPKKEPFYPLIYDIIKDILNFFTFKKTLENIDPMEIIDILLIAEDRRITEAKKTRFTKENYANFFIEELDKFIYEINDIKLIEILKPYTYIWIKPKKLRTNLKKVVEYLKKRIDTFHGKEIKMPVLINQKYMHIDLITAEKQKKLVNETLAIDIGATNTVIMYKLGNSKPEFVNIETISKQYDDALLIPTRLSLKSNSIGKEATGENCILNLKKMLLDGHPDGKKLMKIYLNELSKHLKKNFKGSQGLSVYTKQLSKLYAPVPVGYYEYRLSLKAILKMTFNDMDIETLEEPLAAAIGYQVAEIYDKIVLIIDFGGSTLDIMLLRLNIDNVHVISKPDKSKMLGGSDIDVWLAEYLAEKLKSTQKNINNSVLLDLAEEIKITLSSSKEASFNYQNSEICKVTRENFENILEKHNFYETIDRAISNVLRRSLKIGIKRSEIQAILLTGGTSLIPSFKAKIGSIFPEIRKLNAIYDHSPFTAVAKGAALYGTQNVTDKHLSLAYAVRYVTNRDDDPFAYEIIFEKGENYPFEKTFKLIPAKTLGIQSEMQIEIFEIPENQIIRRWEKENDVEQIKQIVKYTEDMTLNNFRVLSLPFSDPIINDVEVTFIVDNSGHLKIKYLNNELSSGVRLQ
ncbi:MAG: Hsp70 family protein, partial [Spirochaetota bacterium]|nr:Hsp70 family protein [Spirochaetota bacterium]